MAVPAFEDFTENTFLNTATWTLTYPTTVNAGDTLLAHFTVEDNGVDVSAIPSGWYFSLFETQGLLVKSYLFYKFADGTETGNVSWTMSSATADGAGSMYRFSGVGFFSAAATDGGVSTVATPFTGPSCPTRVADAMVCQFLTGDDADAFGDDTGYPTGYTGVNLNRRGTAANQAAQGMAYKTRAVAGTESGVEWTPVGSTDVIQLVMCLSPLGAARIKGDMFESSADITLSTGVVPEAEADTDQDLVLTKPSWVAEGDLMIAILAKDDSATTSWTLATDWVEEVAPVAEASVNLSIASKTAGASEPSTYTFTYGGGINGTVLAGGIIVIENHNSIDPIDVTATTTGSGSTMTFPAVTPASAATLMLLIASNDDDDSLPSFPRAPGNSLRLIDFQTITGSDIGIQAAVRMADASSSGTTIISLDAIEGHALATLAINAAALGAVPGFPRSILARRRYTPLTHHRG